ncbi:MAG: hypothetical protein ACI32C_03755 [Candidatus Enteromonas sp.]
MNFATLVMIACMPLEAAQGSAHSMYSQTNDYPAIDLSVFSHIGTSGFDGKATVIDNCDGYTQYRLELYAMPYTVKSDLYLLEHSMSFVPAYAARFNTGDTKYWEDVRLGRGSITVVLQEKGGPIALKGCWPQRSSIATTVTSSYSGQASFSVETQRKLEQGISLGGGGSIQISDTVSGGSATALSFSWTKSTSSIYDDPMVSGQQLPADKGYGWTYEVGNPDTAGKIAYHMNTYTLFEMKKSETSTSTFSHKLTLKTQCYWYHNAVFPWEQGWKFGDEYSYAVTVN